MYELKCTECLIEGYSDEASNIVCQPCHNKTAALAADRLKIFENYRDDSKGIEILLKETINEQHNLLRRAHMALLMYTQSHGTPHTELMTEMAEELGVEDRASDEWLENHPREEELGDD